MKSVMDPIEEFYDFIENRDFPCVIARSMVSRNAINVIDAGDLRCPADDRRILDFIYRFIEDFRKDENTFQSVAVVFKTTTPLEEDMFERSMWVRLRALQQMDAASYGHDPRVSDDPDSADFSFSLKSEAFFVLALHPGSSRAARRFRYPALVFNPHSLFEKMRKTSSYDKTKAIVRKRDVIFSGSVNPMLTDFGVVSETSQYSGKHYTAGWQCPLSQNTMQ